MGVATNRCNRSSAETQASHQHLLVGPCSFWLRGRSFDRAPACADESARVAVLMEGKPVGSTIQVGEISTSQVVDF